MAGIDRSRYLQEEEGTYGNVITRKTVTGAAHLLAVGTGNKTHLVKLLLVVILLFTKFTNLVSLCLFVSKNIEIA